MFSYISIRLLCTTTRYPTTDDRATNKAPPPLPIASMIKSEIHNNELAIDPLPYSQPQTPRPSLSEVLFRSSFLFPKRLSSSRISMNEQDDHSAATRAATGNSARANKDVACNFSNNGCIHIAAEPSRVSISGDGKTRPSNGKKSVMFYPKVKVYRLEMPCASDMTSDEKTSTWYNRDEYEMFKYNAACSGGVEIVRRHSVNNAVGEHEDDHDNLSFVMVGNFDSNKDSEEEVGENGGNDASGSCVDERLFYNENEYNDTPASCRRGLGYHFSRKRKRSRAIARCVVVRYQRRLRHNDRSMVSSSPSEQMAASTVVGGSSTWGKFDKPLMALALLSAKCSRISREEAKWRGEVDYRIAYPERHVREANSNKRSRDALLDEAAVIDDEANDAGCKMRRTDENRVDGIDGVDEQIAGPIDIYCVDGVRQAAV